jgi:hypothetical protein
MTKRKPGAKKRIPKFGTKAWENFSFQDLTGFPAPDSYHWHVNDYNAALLNWCQRLRMTKYEYADLHERYGLRFHEFAQ